MNDQTDRSRHPQSSDRTLKIEADGGAFSKHIKPKIRLTGLWLRRAGFLPGDHVSVNFKEPGTIELKSFKNSPEDETS